MGLLSTDKTSEESGHINVIAEFKAKAGHEFELRALLSALVPSSRSEEGCKAYHLLESRHEAGSFYTYEEWTSEALLQKHLDGAKDALKKAEPILDGTMKLTVLEHLV